MQTSFLPDKMTWAGKHGIEMLPLEAHWKTDEATQQDFLTPKGKAFIREAASEKRAKFWKRWSPLIGTLIAILALIVSFIALFKK